MKAASRSDLYRKLPSVDDLLRDAAIASLIAREGHTAVADAATGSVDGEMWNYKLCDMAGTFGWPAGLSKKPWQNEGFYLILTVALGLYYISGTEVQFIYGNF